MQSGAGNIAVTVAFFCNDGNGNFVLHKRSNACRDEQGKWDCGGGKLEFGEEPDTAVLREVKEEYGVDGAIQAQLPSYSLFREQDGVKTHWLVIPYLIKIDVKKARIMEPEKAEEIGIFTTNNLPKPMHPGLQKLLLLYKDSLKKV
jgi:8-oxo-dGTP diphosphatase